jgi:hypothetical protein
MISKKLQMPVHLNIVPFMSKGDQLKCKCRHQHPYLGRAGFVGTDSVDGCGSAFGLCTNILLGLGR